MASAAGIAAAVTNSRHTEDSHWTVTAWVAVRNRGLATPAAARGPAGVHIVRMPEPRASIETVSGPLPAGSQQTAQEITERNSPR